MVPAVEVRQAGAIELRGRVEECWAWQHQARSCWRLHRGMPGLPQIILLAAEQLAPGPPCLLSPPTLSTGAPPLGAPPAACRAGNSLLFYGFGSKHDLLQRFARSETADGACITVNGLSAGLTAKQVVVWAAATLKGTKPQHYRSYAKEQLFELMLKDSPNKHIYVVIHNIDGPGALGCLPLLWAGCSAWGQ